MKFLHTSDWHLGKRLLDKERFEEQENVMQEIVDIANQEQVDVIFVAGDLFDTYAPSSMAQRLFYETLQALSDNGRRLVVALAGNHDSPERVESPEALANISGIFLLGYPNSILEPFVTNSGIQILKSEFGFVEFQLPKITYPIRILYTPYANQERLKLFLGDQKQDEQLRDILENKWKAICEKYCDNKGVNLLVAHLFVTKDGDDEETQEPDDENGINIGGASAIYTNNIPFEIQYVALGHLHRCQRLESREIWYSGSPLEYSFAESEQQKYVLISEIEPGKQVITKKIPLRSGCKLVSKFFSNVNEAQQWLCKNQNVWVDLTLETDTYLTPTELKSLYAVHNKIVTLRPYIKSSTIEENKTSRLHEIIHDKDALFTHFFESQKGQKPNQEIIQLFHEILALQ